MVFFFWLPIFEQWAETRTAVPGFRTHRRDCQTSYDFIASDGAKSLAKTAAGSSTGQDMEVDMTTHSRGIKIKYSATKHALNTTHSPSGVAAGGPAGASAPTYHNPAKSAFRPRTRAAIDKDTCHHTAKHYDDGIMYS